MKKLLAAILLCVACEPAPFSDRFQADASVSDEQLAMMQNEARILCEATDWIFCAEISRDDAPNSIRIGETDKSGETG